MAYNLIKIFIFSQNLSIKVQFAIKGLASKNPFVIILINHRIHPIIHFRFECLNPVIYKTILYSSRLNKLLRKFTNLKKYQKY